MIRAASLLVALCLVGCGGGPRVSQPLRDRLGGDESAEARERAPELARQVEAALDDADEAAAGGDDAAADDHLTRARLLLEAALAEAARIDDERARREVEAEVARIRDRARRDERARAELEREAARLAASRSAREETLAALALAEEDEARGGRRARVSLEETADLRRAAAALRERARLVLGAAIALGAPEPATSEVTAALRASEEARTDPLLALREADRANHEALAALGAARAEMDGPPAGAALALAEAATAEGFSPLALPEGTGVEVEGLFSGSGVSRGASARLERVAAFVAAHPHGPVQVQAQVTAAGSAGERVAARRAEALRRALVTAGVSAERLTAQAIPAALRGDAPREVARLVFVAY